MRSVVVCNANSSLGAAGGKQLEVLAADANCRYIPVTSNDEVRRVCYDYVDQGGLRLIVAGGDGTISHAVQAIAPRFESVELGIIPLGTGNDFARSLGIASFDVPTAFECALEGCVKPVDLIQASDDHTTYYVNAASGGFGGEVTARVSPDSKRRWGPFAYWMTAMAKFIDLTPYRVKLELNDSTIDQSVFGLAISNGKYVGGGFEIAPDAKVDDGQLDVIVIPELPKVELLGAGINYFLGREDPDGVQMYQAPRAHVQCEPTMRFSIDGEPLQHVEATFEIVPHSLRFAVPNVN